MDYKKIIDSTATKQFWNHYSGVYEQLIQAFKDAEELENADMDKTQPTTSDVEQSEQLKCQCKKAKFTRTVDANFNFLCGRCGKMI